MKNRRLFRLGMFISIFAVALSFTSCMEDLDSDYEKQVNTDDEKLSKHISDNNIQAQKNSWGFYYQAIVTNDTGRTLSRNNVVDFTYKISLLDGTVLEESTLENQLSGRFKLLNRSIVPEALDKGISLMKTGEKFRFYIPAYLAYGYYGNTTIPANSHFIVEIAVTGVQSETDIEVAQLDSLQRYFSVINTVFEKFASGLYYVENITGTGTKPHYGDRVTISFTRKYLDTTIIKKVDSIDIILGYGDAVQGLEEGIMQMREGGKASLFMPASIAFKESLMILPQKAQTELLRDQVIRSEVKPYSMVQYNVELKAVN